MNKEINKLEIIEKKEKKRGDFVSMKAYFASTAMIGEKVFKDENGEELIQKFLSVNVKNATKNENEYYSFFMAVNIIEKNKILLNQLTGKTLEELSSLEKNAKLETNLGNEKSLPYILENVSVTPFISRSLKTGKYEVKASFGGISTTRLKRLDDTNIITFLERQEIPQDKDYFYLKGLMSLDKRQDAKGSYNETGYDVLISKKCPFANFMHSYLRTPLEIRKMFSVILNPSVENEKLDKTNKKIILTENDFVYLCYTSLTLSNKVESIKKQYASQKGIIELGSPQQEKEENKSLGGENTFVNTKKNNPRQI